MQHAKWQRKLLQGFRRSTGTKEMTCETQYGVRFGMKMGMSVFECALGSLAGTEAGGTWAPVINVCNVSN